VWRSWRELTGSQDPAPPAFGHCGAAAVGRDG
jgi:hypothetical protein